MYTVHYPNQMTGKAQQLWQQFRMWLADDYERKSRLAFILILVGALAGFEVFNFSTTEFALSDLLGGASVFGISWATTLALAFCVIDFAGLSRLFTPSETREQSLEVWYLLGAWFLGATLNAAMTWWAVSLAMMNSTTLGNELFARDQLITYVPIFIAALVWVTRMFIIGAFRLAADRLYQQMNGWLGRGSAFYSVSQPQVRTVRGSSYRIGSAQPARVLPAMRRQPAPAPVRASAPLPQRANRPYRQWTQTNLSGDGANDKTNTRHAAAPKPAPRNPKYTPRMPQPQRPSKPASTPRMPRTPKKNKQSASRSSAQRRQFSPAPRAASRTRAAAAAPVQELTYEDFDTFANDKPVINATLRRNH